jgi:Holliday junction DNA helicase RuvA
LGDLQLTLQSLNYSKNEIKNILPIIIKETDGLSKIENNSSFENLLKLAMNYLDNN